MGGRLDGKAAVITGGASGIGAASARLFANEGARVVIADVQDDMGVALAAELGGSALYQHTDVSKEDDVRRGIERAVAEFGRLDCIFSNAGILGTVGPLEEIPVEEYDRTMDVLLRSVFLGMKHAAPVMKRQHSGSMISTSSIAGIIAGDGPHVYNVAKAAIIQLTKSAALEMGPHNVRVNTICPGGIVTPLVTGGVPGNPQVEAAAKAALAQFQPIPRAGMPDDIAYAALWLASDESSFVSGHALVVDGAATAGTPWHRQPEPFRVRPPARA
ncbi:MAG: glucose 1-dehydrogenase [Chloroflexota bacterium]|nr:glucose 1-dehydrogenase [Chloroflexota bacterium]